MTFQRCDFLNRIRLNSSIIKKSSIYRWNLIILLKIKLRLLDAKRPKYVYSNNRSFYIHTCYFHDFLMMWYFFRTGCTWYEYMPRIDVYQLTCGSRNHSCLHCVSIQEMGLISVQYNLHCIKYTRGCGGVARPPTNILHEVFCNNSQRLLAKFSVSDVCGDSSYNSVRCVYDQ